MLHYCYADMTTVNGIWVPESPVFSFKKQPTGPYSNQNIVLRFSEDEAILLSVQDIYPLTFCSVHSQLQV
jgi:hypothetical protein